MSTAVGYGRPQIVFSDGVCHRCILELRVPAGHSLKKRKAGGEQWIFNSKDVEIRGVWFYINSPPYKGEERLNRWNCYDEAVGSDGVVLD